MNWRLRSGCSSGSSTTAHLLRLQVRGCRGRGRGGEAVAIATAAVRRIGCNFRCKSGGGSIGSQLPRPSPLLCWHPPFACTSPVPVLSLRPCACTSLPTSRLYLPCACTSPAPAPLSCDGTHLPPVPPLYCRCACGCYALPAPVADLRVGRRRQLPTRGGQRPPEGSAGAYAVPFVTRSPVPSSQAGV